MDQLPLVSVILPVYNLANIIREPLEAALSQTYPNIEYIIVDDASTDNTLQLIREIIEGEPFCRRNISILHQEKNGGAATSRNIGVEAANGDYIYFADADDVITPDCIALHVKAISEAPENVDFTDANIRIVGRKNQYFHSHTDRHIVQGVEVTSGYFRELHISACNKLIKRDLFRQFDLHFISGMLYEDNYWVYLLCLAAEGYITLPDYTYDYIMRDNSITKKKSCEHSRKQLHSFGILFEKMTEAFGRTPRCFSHSEPADHDALRGLQSNWYARWLLVIRGRLLMSPLPAAEKRAFDRQLCRYATFCTPLKRPLFRLPYPLFSLLFRFPHALFRLTRR